jgi:hypothetical protein
MTGRLSLALLTLLTLAACTVRKDGDKTLVYPSMLESEMRPDVLPPPVIRQPVLPEMLVPCRGHVLVPALGMQFVPRNATAPDNGQFLREERLSPPYRIITPGARLSPDQNPQRLNVELDRGMRIIGLYCG